MPALNDRSGLRRTAAKLPHCFGGVCTLSTLETRFPVFQRASLQILGQFSRRCFPVSNKSRRVWALDRVYKWTTYFSMLELGIYLRCSIYMSSLANGKNSSLRCG